MTHDPQKAPRGRRFNVADTCVRPDLHTYNPTTTLTFSVDKELVQVDLDDGIDQVRQVLTWVDGCLSVVGPWIKL